MIICSVCEPYLEDVGWKWLLPFCSEIRCLGNVNFFCLERSEERSRVADGRDERNRAELSCKYLTVAKSPLVPTIYFPPSFLSLWCKLRTKFVSCNNIVCD